MRAKYRPKPLWGLLALLAGLSLIGCDIIFPSPSPTPPLPAPAATPSTPSPAPSPGTTPEATSGALVLTLRVAEIPSDLPQYDRGEWRHWRDADRDCQDARQEALIEESLTPVVFKTEDECRVESGNWVGPYTGTEVTDPSKLDIDHMVPLANAHRSGGWQWDRDRKAEYANNLDYPDHLIATTSAANRAKGSDGPEDWRPPDESYWCEYAIDWATIKNDWGLTATAREVAALNEMLDACPQETVLQTR